MVSDSRLKELIELKNKQRAVSKADFMKQVTNPYKHMTGEGGTVFDSGIQRWVAMEATKLHFFKPNFKNAIMGMVIYVIPLGLTMYWIKTVRDNKENKFRSGLVSYRDREYKFI